MLSVVLTYSPPISSFFNRSTRPCINTAEGNVLRNNALNTFAGHIIIVHLHNERKLAFARCISVVRAFTHDPSWWTHQAISRSSQCSTTSVTKAVVCAILSVGWCI